MASSRTYIAIDLKSFYASVECVERGLDPLTTNLVVADESRTEKTICLAVSPALKSFGIPGRPRLFEVVQKVSEVNAQRAARQKSRKLDGKSTSILELEKNKGLAVDYIVATPRMAYYMDYSTRIYNIYLRYVSAEDMHVYSVDEVFIDATDYLRIYKLSARQLAMRMIGDVLKETGITATVGIGTNLYLCKIAMDIVAKHAKADADGVRIAELNEMEYRKLLWTHRPLTDFWRVGTGYTRKLEKSGIYTMGDIARVSIDNEDMLYKMFGVNAELLIDHAWGYESCTIKDIKKYKPENNSYSSGQVLSRPYTFDEARIIMHEMADAMAIDLSKKHMLTDQMVITVNYDIESLKYPNDKESYKGELQKDYYGRTVPKHAHGSINLGEFTALSSKLIEAVLELYDMVVDKSLLVRRMNIVANHIIPEGDVKTDEFEQLDIFSFDKSSIEEKQREEDKKKKELRLQQAVLSIKNRYGKNAILKGTNFQEGATMRERNKEIGGHRA